jgi:phosphatidylglycerol:prolipoprotein diacylglycerol transferase
VTPGRLAYTLFMALALVVFVVARRLVPQPPGVMALPWWKRASLSLAALVGGAIGAKLPFVFSSEENWLSETAWLSDGKTIVTGLAGAYLAVELMKAALGVRVKTGDGYALPLALALAVGRWGCFFNGCCFGVTTHVPWACDFGDGQPRHPTQIYEILFHLSMALVIWECARHDLFRTHRLQLYLIAYTIYRFTTEFIRPEPIWFLGFTFYQWAALALAAVLAAQWLMNKDEGGRMNQR